MTGPFDHITDDLIQDGPTSIEDPVEQDVEEIEVEDFEPDDEDDDDDRDEGPEENKTGTDAPLGDEPGEVEEVSLPGRLNAQERALFAKMPRDLQAPVAEIFKREQAKFTRVSQEAKSLQERYQPLERVLGPRRQALAMSGFREDQVVEQLFALSDFANAQPTEFLKWFCQTNRIDPQALLQQQTPQYIDPELKKRDDEIAALRNHVHQLGGKISSRETAELNQRQTEVRTQIHRFKTARGTDGQPLHPDFDSVEEEMALYVRRDPTMSLDDAYDRAVYANPSTRKRLLAQDRQQLQAEQRKHAEKARRAGSSVSGNGASTIRRQNSGGSVAEQLSDVWDAALHGSL